MRRVAASAFALLLVALPAGPAAAHGSSVQTAVETGPYRVTFYSYEGVTERELLRVGFAVADRATGELRDLEGSLEVERLDATGRLVERTNETLRATAPGFLVGDLTVGPFGATRYVLRLPAANATFEHPVCRYTDEGVLECPGGAKPTPAPVLGALAALALGGLRGRAPARPAPRRVAAAALATASLGAVLLLAAPAVAAAEVDLAARSPGACPDGRASCFDRDALAVPAGVEVTMRLTNPPDAQAPHSLCVDLPDASRCTARPHEGIGPGSNASLRLPAMAPGVYRYACAVPGHADAGMVGNLTVGDGGAERPARPVPGAGFLAVSGGLAAGALAVRRRPP